MENKHIFSKVKDAHILRPGNPVLGMYHRSMGVNRTGATPERAFLFPIMMEEVYCHVVGKGQVSSMS